MIHSSPVEDIEDSTGSLCIDGPSVSQGVSDKEMLCGYSMTVKRVLEDPLHHPLGRRSTLSKPSASQSQTHQPVPHWRDLFWSGQPPPLASEDLVKDLLGLHVQPGTTIRLGKAGTPLG